MATTTIVQNLTEIVLNLLRSEKGLIACFLSFFKVSTI